MPFVLTFPWRAFVLAMRDRDRANKNEIAIFVFSVATKGFPHDMLLYGLKKSDMAAHLRHRDIAARPVKAGDEAELDWVDEPPR